MMTELPVTLLGGAQNLYHLLPFICFQVTFTRTRYHAAVERWQWQNKVRHSLNKICPLFRLFHVIFPAYDLLSGGNFIPLNSFVIRGSFEVAVGLSAPSMKGRMCLAG